MPLNQVEVTEETLREVAARTLLAIQAGAAPKSVAELPPIVANAKPRNADAWGTEFTFTLVGENKKTKTATVVSAGADKQAGTADDIRCVTTFEFQAGPGYDVYLQGLVQITQGAQ